MTDGAGLMLLGVVPAQSPAPRGAPSHHRVPGPRWDGIALQLEPHPPGSAEDETIRLAMLQHELLCRYVAESDVIPVSLGSVFSTASALRRHLLAEQARFDRCGEAVFGRCAFTIRLARAPGIAPRATTTKAGGAEFLAQKRALRDRRLHRADALAALVAEVEQNLNARALNTRRRENPAGTRIAEWDVVLPRHLTAEFPNSLDALAQEASALQAQLQLVGPFPVFGFLAEAA